MITEAFLKRVLMFVGVILSGLITLIFISTPESLQVPVPDQFPTITTKSALALEFKDAKKYFETSIKEKIAGASVDSIISWSPNSKYILANLIFSEKDQNNKTTFRTKPYVLDMPSKTYIPLPNATRIDQVSWNENTLTYPADTGYGIFDIEKNTGQTFGSLVNGGQPVFSDDGSYVAYQENGIVLYSLKTEKSIRITNNIGDMPAVWKTDDKTLVFFRTDDVLKKKQSLMEINIGKKEIKLLADLPQSAQKANWIEKDKLVLLTLGYDAGSFDYAFDFSNNSLKLIAETSEGIAFTSVAYRQLATLKGNKISLYDVNAEKVSETKRSEKSKVANFFLLPPPSIFLIREKGASFDSSLFNLSDGTERVLKDLWQSKALVAPNYRNAIVIKKGGSSVEFVDIPM